MRRARRKRLKYSVLRYVAATGWGGIGLVMATCALWIFTSLPVEYILFYALFIYGVIIGSVLIASEQPKHRTKPAVSKPRQTEFKMYNMKEGSWDVQ